MGVNNINESRIPYDTNHKERMNRVLEKQLKNREHSLGAHPALPEGDEINFEERIAGKHFDELVKNYKKHFDVSRFEGPEVMMNSLKYLRRCLKLEEPHTKELIAIAIDLVMKEFDIPEGELIINAELTSEIDPTSFRENFLPRNVEELEFENHQSIVDSNKEVLKRRFINSMNQGSANKASHLFNFVESKVNDLNPRLTANYSKMIAASDLTFFLINDTVKSMPGGTVDVEYPKNENEPAVINAQGVIFPILLHEIVKGVMEVITTNALPEDEKLCEYVKAKADFSGANNWDMRLGTKIWEAFVSSIEEGSTHLKHHVYNDLVDLPVDEFNETMKEILAGTKKGKSYVKQLTDDIKEEIRKDEFNASLIDDKFDDDEFFELNELDDIDPTLIN